MAASTPDIVDLLERYFPDELYYSQAIGPNRLFHGNPFAALIPTLTTTSELARCLGFMPDAVVLFRNLPPERGAFFVRFFPEGISLDATVAQTYQRYFPSAILLYAPSLPEYIWLADYLAEKPPTRKHFELQP